MDLINDTHESCLNIGKRFLWGFALKLTKSVLLKSRTRGFKMALLLRGRHALMWQSLTILNIFNALILQQIFWKTKTFFKFWSTVFQLKELRLKTKHFHTKLLCQKPILRHVLNNFCKSVFGIFFILLRSKLSVKM